MLIFFIYNIEIYYCNIMELIGLIIAILISLIIAIGMLLISILIGPKRDNPSKAEPFECGAEKCTPLPDTFPVKFYIVALLFVLFDIEAAFFFPWAFALLDLKLYGFLIMIIYLAILIFGYAYFWKKGGFDWK